MKSWKRRISLLLVVCLVLGLMPMGALAVVDDPASVFHTEPMVAAGSAHTMALQSDGTVWAWGNNSHGQLGDGSGGPGWLLGYYSTTPVQVQTLTNVIVVSAGRHFVVALQNDGAVWAFGDNVAGQLGIGADGFWSVYTTPVQTLGPDGEGFLNLGTAPPRRHPFTDVPRNAWFHDAVASVYEYGLMNGTTSTTFSPHTPLNRAMLATILWRMAGEPEVEFQPVFSDVSSNAPTWYRDAILWAYENGIVRGYDGRFDPYGDVTREQAAAMFHRYAQFAGIGTGVPDAFDLADFRDRDEISAWAEAYMVWAVYHELIQGVGGERLAPGDPATRAEGAAILMRFMQGVAD